MMSDASDPDDSARRAMRRGMWVWNTATIIEDTAQIDRLILCASAIDVNDIYLYVVPAWYDGKNSKLAAFNSRLHAHSIQVWAVDGGPAYLDTLAAGDAFIAGLRSLGEFNDRSEPCARFHGFQADLQPEDSAGRTGCFHKRVAESRLTQQQHIERTMVLQKLLNLLTRTSNMVHSLDMPFAVAMPFWLQDYEGEPVTVAYTGKHGTRMCVMELIMPVVDEYLVLNHKTEFANVAKFISAPAEYASDMAGSGQRMPHVLGSFPVTDSAGQKESHREAIVKITKDISSLEAMLQLCPTFAGLALHDWEALDKLSND
ncbi:hypothetical protein BAUCODRAFT_25802 [Baudoinia panamericana UAMH 10762]|uniref:Uncharacterized protein n=1 Tax=Baudoinia panamericana (strain UAMH 10762) TaxID=717646 RepID=M2LK81_BAUPA|nr:uncharacterized protein BAUCODRAFT_25802 [Baudoinia panamericana UAMH 10762]EMC94657.1 hypothetical protein BAUCODRAFT_25802 [Baudoinia panamericana UAMH 10762]